MARFWTAVAPVRVADLGGWTDTWFAGHGLVCSIAVRPGVEVRLTVEEPRSGSGSGSVVVDAVNYGDRYVLTTRSRGRHPLLEGCIDEVGVPDGLDVTVSVHSDVPAGASTGTSASVAVALVGALAALRDGTGTGSGSGDRAMAPADAAALAHRVEAERLGRQTGIQDQRAAAFGGINRIAMRSYPTAVDVTPVAVGASTGWELDARLLLVFLGRTHVSSVVHEQVIAGLEGAGPDELTTRLDPLRRAAEDGAAALEAGDLAAYGRALAANTAAQAALHPALVGPEATEVIEAGRRAGAVGWKVNGAGGAGGSVTLLAGPEAGGRRRVAEAVLGANPRFAVLPTSIDHTGLRVWATDG